MVSSKKFSSLGIIIYILCNVGAFPRTRDPLEDEPGPVVETNVGSIRGLQADDGDYSMFMGIPYAQLDNDNLFGRALPYPHFESTFDAVDDSSICPQIEEFNFTIVGTVDCLHLNVYVPNNASADNRLPILVWIFGGAFSIGFAGRFLYGPSFIVRHDVIFITFNYRLGPYGFMCLDTPEVPGNQGLKDQVMALRWIKQNIGAFGGDDSRITIAGSSSGGTSVDFLLYYGPDENLFHKIILQSGVALMSRTIKNSDPTAPLKLAKYFNYTQIDLRDALSFLATVESDQLIAATHEIGASFGPCIEKEFDDVDNLITHLPVNMDIPKLKNIEVLIGFTKNEQCYLVAPSADKNMEAQNLYFVQYSMNSHFDFKDDDERYKTMHEIVTHFYFGDENITADLWPEVIDVCLDFFFLYPTLRTVEKYIDNGVETLYLYLFSYDGGRNFLKHKRKRDLLNIEIGGAAHADELGYLFDISYMEKPLDPEDQLMVDRITQLWANFVKYGNPTPELTELVPVYWPAVTRDKWHYLELDSEIRISSRPYHARMAFLDLFYKKNERYQIGYERDDTPKPSTATNIASDLSLPALLTLIYLLNS